MAQMGSIGPFIGQYHFFYKFNKGLSEVGEKRYFEMTKKVYEVLENHLSKNDYLAGENYSIADIATWPWIARHQWHDIGLKRLMARPVATLCIAAQEKHEKDEKVYADD